MSGNGVSAEDRRAPDGATESLLAASRSRASQALEQESTRAWVEILARDVLALADDLEETRRALKAAA